MKKSPLLGVVCACVFSVTGTSTFAALIDRGGGLIYDEDLNITWLQNANYVGAVEMEWLAAMDWAANLAYYDSVRDVTYTDWRLPTADASCGTQYRCYDSEMGHLYYRESGELDKFANLMAERYWTSTVFLSSAPYAFTFNFLDGRQTTNSQYVDYVNVWAVRDGDVTAVPLPASLWLFSSGLLGLIGVARKKGSSFINYH